MRRRVMAAFMCAIMTMSVIPVNADDTQVAKAQQEMESTVKTETTTEMSTQSTTKTEKKKKGFLPRPDKSTAQSAAGSAERKLTGTVRPVVREASSLFRITVSPATRATEETSSSRVEYMLLSGSEY